MIIEQSTLKRKLKLVELNSDLVIIGGGLAGTCAAITAARFGLKVVLVQDRPVLGGNSSSEVRLWVLGATSHMGNNNRWAREGGLIDEILLENAYRNPEGNPLIYDTILLEKVVNEQNIRLLLNTAVYDVEKKDANTIQSVKAFCSQNSTEYILSAPLFTDSSGDGIVGFLAGAAFRMGAESKEEFGEAFAPQKEYGELLGHSIYFYSKNTGKPVKFIPPAFALNDISKIPRFKNFNSSDFGCRLWWIEYGGRLDTIHETETIKWELWKVVYGVWNYIKNSGQFPDAENLTLEWVGTIPGKRESRRFEGDYMIMQQDIIEQKMFHDAVAFGGWSIDLHPADGVFSELSGCNQWHSKGVYGIPYRSYYSKNITNLFLAGRIMSATHVAFGSTRVMATCAHGGQAIAAAAYLCNKYQKSPKEIGTSNIEELQMELLKTGQHIPGLTLHDQNDLVQKAISIDASTTYSLNEIPASADWQTIEHSVAQMLPLNNQQMPSITFYARCTKETTLKIELRKSSKSFNHTPDITLEEISVNIIPGKEIYTISFSSFMNERCYAFVCFMKNAEVSLCFSDLRISGLLSVYNAINIAVSNYGKQEPPANIGVDAFEFWCPKRRPNGKNIAMEIKPALDAFSTEFLRNGIQRPVSSTNAWVANVNDLNPFVAVSWKEEVIINKIELFFDADYDHPLETVLLANPETTMVYCVKHFKILDDKNQVIAEINGNYLTRRVVEFSEPVKTKLLKVVLDSPNANAPASLFEIRCY
jgi:FAD dependent oxidoreductase